MKRLTWILFLLLAFPVLAQATGTDGIVLPAKVDGIATPAKVDGIAFTYCTSQTITLTDPTDMTVGDADQSITCSASSGLACSLSVNNTGYATVVSGPKLHAVGASGTNGLILYADQSGNGTYCSAPQASQTVTISAAPSDTWYWSSPAESTNADNNVANSYAAGYTFTTLSGKTADALAIDLYSSDSSTSCKIALRNASGNLITSCTVTSPSSGTNSCTITSTAITGNVSVTGACNNGADFNVDNTLSPGTYENITYSSFPASTATMNANGYAWRCGIYAH
jgi:hypothetical protein